MIRAFRYGDNSNNMANTYSQIYLHVIFSVKDRESLILPEYEQELHSYLCGACKNRKHMVIAIGGMPDHIHLLISMHPSEGVSALVQSIKVQSSLWMHNKGVAKFSWQAGYAAFSYSKSQLPQVAKYILNQKEHHKDRSFDNEILHIAQKSGIEFKREYLLKGIE